MLYVLFMAIVCAIAVGQFDAAPDSAVSSLRHVFMLTCVCLVVPIGCALMAVRWNRKTPTDLPSFEQRSIWLLRCHALTWFISAAGIIYWARWPDAIRTLCNDAILINEVLIVAPMLTSWLISWAVFYAWYSDEMPPIGRARFVWNQSRLTLLLAWIPVLMFCVIHDTVAAILPMLSDTSMMPMVFLINFGALIVFFPRLLGWLWETKPLPDGPLRQRLLTMAQDNHLRIREIHVWHTDQRIANAAVAGIFPSTRRVFLTDVLLAHFTDDEIEAAFAHELGHVCHHHSLFRMALLLVPLSLAMLGSALAPLATWTVEHDLSIPSVIGVSAYLIVALGWYSRRLEHEADLWACQQLAVRHGKADALQRYVGVLFRLGDRRHLHRGSWLHPGHKHRRRFLITCLSNLNRAKSFQREMKWLAAVLFVTALLPLLLLAV